MKGITIAMTSATSTFPSSFFGLRPASWPAQWRSAWQLLLESRALRAFTPAVPVRLLQADGRVSDWSLHAGVAHAVAARPSADKATIWAIELPRARVLERQLVLPLLGAADLEQAIQLEVAAFTPFGADKTAHGYRAVRRRQQTQVDLVLAQRRDVEHCAQALVAEAGVPGAGAVPEVWVLPAGVDVQAASFSPILLAQGGSRQRLIARGRAVRLALLGLVLGLAAALAVTPTAQLRLRAIAAQQAFDALRAQTAPQQAQREALMQRSEQLSLVHKLTADQRALVPIFNLLTSTLPDGAWLQSLRVEGGKVQVTGRADDTSALVQTLGRQRGVLAVRLPAPVTRDSNAAKESFTLELSFDPAVFGALVPQEGA